jgi:dCMP deaminase
MAANIACVPQPAGPAEEWYKKDMILGLTGRNAAGKGEAARFLETKGFTCYSLSDVIREEVTRLGLEMTRENLIRVGREMRSRLGTGCLAEAILRRLEPDRNYVVDSIRHPDEVAVFRTRPNFRLLAIRAEAPVRFDRIQARGRPGDPTTLERFVELEAEENRRTVEEGQDLEATEALADFVIENNGDLMAQLDRPGWDEYFMKIAQVAALRSNCIKRKVGAAIVRDRRIVSTGYNGTPRGTRNCYEGGCPRCNSLADSGTRLDECLCSHAEENAITQAAYHGVSVRGGTLYTTFSPCLMCTKMIINAGIREVVYNEGYPLGETSVALLHEAGVVCRRLRCEGS